MANFEDRDLWWEARQKTAQQAKASIGLSNAFRSISMSVAGAPTRAISVAAANLGRDKAGLAIDLNKYRPGRDLARFVDAGVDAFILRIGGPGQWVSGNWRYTEDATFRPYMEQADKIGMLNRTVGYIIHNPFEDWRLENNVHVDLLNQWTGGGYMPASLCLDHEIATCWQNGQETRITPFNLVSSLAAVTDKMAKKFKKPVSIYTARWFTNSNGPTEHVTYFDNINKPASLGGPGKQRPSWFAWYPQSFTKEYANLEDSLSELIIPTGDQTGKFLAIGSYTTADLWQYTDRLKLTGDPTGVDANVTLGTLDSFLQTFGLGAQKPPDPDPDPEPEPIPEDIEARLQALEGAVSELTTWVKSYRG